MYRFKIGGNMARKKVQEVLLSFGKIVLVVSFVTLFVCPYSCRLTEEGITVLKSDYRVPKIENFSVLSESCAKLSFSQTSQLKNLIISPQVQFSVEDDFYKNSDSIHSVVINFKESLSPGAKYVVFGTACDEIGNSLTFSIPFFGYNNNIPKLKIVEVHPGNGSYSYKKNKVYVTEYVVLEVVDDGNLASILLFSAWDGEDSGYVFPAVNVKKGEKILVHLRTRDDEKSGAIDELEDDITLSTASFSKDSMRDLWNPDSSSKYNDKTDIIVLKDTGSDLILDAIMYATSETVEWQNDNMTSLAEQIASSELWNGFSPSDALCSDSLTSTKCFVKTAEINEKSSWKIDACKLNAAAMQ